MMSGLTLTYSRALRLGDFVRIGDIEGTVTHLGNLSTKLKTPRREEVTIPNSVAVSTQTTNFSRFADDEGVFTPTAVTIGYDTPWRHVEALLLMAARTEGVRSTPPPAVRQTPRFAREMTGIRPVSAPGTSCECIRRAAINFD
jgi:small-conductance mechanosensitive channel